jgi:hypothetical protein
MGVYGLETKANHYSHAKGIMSPSAAVDERLYGRPGAVVPAVSTGEGVCGVRPSPEEEARAS